MGFSFADPLPQFLFWLLLDWCTEFDAMKFLQLRVKIVLKLQQKGTFNVLIIYDS